MKLEVKRPFQRIMDFVELINPYVVIISIIGLVLEYTRLSLFGPLIVTNQFIDVYFFIEFVFRMIAYTSMSVYFLKKYGWVDMLAAIPGLMILVSLAVGNFAGGGALFGLIKLTRVGKFFKIIRILRFMKVFSFLKKMKADSAYIQDRIMKISVSTVLVLLVGLFFIDIVNTKDFVNIEKDKVNTYIDLEGNTAFFDNLHKFGITAYKTDTECKKVVRSGTGEKAKMVLIDMSGEDFTKSSRKTFINSITVDKIPDITFLIRMEKSYYYHNHVMLILVLSIVLLLLVQLFYLGFVLAKDIRIVQLIVDSIEADDFFLLNEERRQVELEDGTAQVVDGEDEILSLRKVSGSIGYKVKELDDRENEIREKEYALSASEDAALGERISVESAVKRTADEIYQKLSGKSVSGSIAANEIVGDIDSDLIDMEGLGFGDMNGLDSMIGADSSIGNSSDGGSISNLDVEMMINKIVEKTKDGISESWYNEGVEKITKKIIVSTLNRVMPKVKDYLDNRDEPLS